METQYARTALLIGEKGIRKLQRSHVAVFGVGGVGGAVCEALARAGIGTLSLIDKDTVSLTNLNRQIIALHSTIGQQKVAVMRDRILDIDPSIRVFCHPCFFLPETAGRFDFSAYDYIVDAVDTVTAKIQIILQAQEAGVPVISAMGAGNKLDPSRFQVADLYKTTVCPLAKVMRRELKKRGVEHLKVVYSQETPVLCSSPNAASADPLPTHTAEAALPSAHPAPGSISFVPPVAGYILAGEVVRDILGNEV